MSMHLPVLRVLGIAALCVTSNLFMSAAHAEENDFSIPVVFNFFLAEYDITKGQGQFSGDSASETTRSENTLKLGKSYIAVPYKDLTLYLYPFSDGNRYLGLGYMVTQKLQLGVDGARAKNSNRVDNGQENNSTLGAFATWYDTIGSIGLEATLNYDVTWNTSRSENQSSHIVTTTSARTSFAKPDILFFYPLSKSLFYFNGIGYSVAKTKSDGNLVSNRDLNITLAGVRFGLK